MHIQKNHPTSTALTVQLLGIGDKQPQENIRPNQCHNQLHANMLLQSWPMSL
jgi:hypothetical protein